MTDQVQPVPIRDRIKDINTKAYYLLVALSFIYGTASGARLTLRCALTLTAVVAVMPVQDYITSDRKLQSLRFAKVIGLIAALVCALVWVWTETATTH